MTAETAVREAIKAALVRINEAWFNGRPEDMRPLLHPDMTLAPPGFVGREHGAERYIEGHRGFAAAAELLEFSAHDYQIDTIEDTAIATYRYELVYERSGRKYRSIGRDLWVLRRSGGDWLAVWRTLLDIDEQAV